MSLAEQVALVVAVVATLRVRLPKLDGWLVLLVAAVCAGAVSAAADSEVLPQWARQGVMVFFYAVGGVSLAKTAGRRIWPEKVKDDKA